MQWNGTVGQGVSTFHVQEEDAASAYAAVRDFFDDIKAVFVPSLTLSFPSSGDVIDLATGGITGSWTASPLADVTGTASSAFRAAGVGARIAWTTGVVNNGRRVRGATFITEVSVANYEANGTLTNDLLLLLRSAAGDLVDTGLFGVYSRLGPSGGLFSPWTGSDVPDRVTSLRSRRF